MAGLPQSIGQPFEALSTSHAVLGQLGSVISLACAECVSDVPCGLCSGQEGMSDLLCHSCECYKVNNELAC